MIEQIIFSILAVITLVSGFIVVTDRNLFHAALAMMLSFLGVAGFYVLLDAGFMAAAQLLVYIGAISILIIFAIMMTRRMMTTTETPFNSQYIASAIASFGFFALLAFIILRTWTPTGILIDQPLPPTSDAVLDGSVTVLGAWLVSSDAYVLPFEVISVLLLAALVGAIVIARPRREGEEVDA